MHPDMTENNCFSYYGGSRSSVDQFYSDFADASICLSDSMGDYVKIANLLFVYWMFAYLDEKRLVDSWACALIEDDEGWRRFLGGLWFYDVLMHRMGRFFTSSRQISATNLCHAYVLIWVLQVHPASVIPRCLRWAPHVVYRTVQFHDFFDIEREC